MGKRPAEVELFVGNMGSIQREIRASMQREETPTMETGLERIAVKGGFRYCDQSCISPIGSCKLSRCCESTSEERSAGNPHATFCGNRRRVTASGDPVGKPRGFLLSRLCLNAGGELELANRGTNMPNTAPVVHSDPDILGGTPVFVGTRVPFRNLIDYLERNHSLDEFLDSFPSVSREQAVASLEAAHEALSARAHSA